MNKEALKLQLTGEGYPHVYEWHDEPGTEYPTHAHKGAVALYILDGDIKFWFEDGIVELKTGDRFDVPIAMEHAATVGEKGCTFLVGEMIEGDS